eukprot:TRINITY_DN12097_c0_g1_i1.p1 TRINITY_DN12097_c0_g1~~TRINITY_DN12097_c0_g1_i1.p1  ORF type:complete len:254 (+),score=45.59 TRINITY_DN12097_c0_g1_i1:34-795(+)
MQPTFYLFFYVMALVYPTVGFLGLAVSDEQDEPTRSYAKSTKMMGDCTLEYVYKDGREFLSVLGPLPRDFDSEAVMEHFRTSLKGLPPVQPTKGPANGQKSIFESVSSYFTSLYVDSSRSEIQEHLLKAKEELDTLDAELNNAMTQQLILRKRQADLGNYITESLKNGGKSSNPTVDELVLTEDDRLALLEQRLLRVSKQLKHKKRQLEEFIKLHEEIIGQPTVEERERHIFTQSVPVVIPDYTRYQAEDTQK